MTSKRSPETSSPRYRRSDRRQILTATRTETLRLIVSTDETKLDWIDPQRHLPPFASWRTVRELAWHIADTESRYYLPATGQAAAPRHDDLVTELTSSHRHVVAALDSVPADRAHHAHGETWTTTKLLRRLAWHERGELDVMRNLVERASTVDGRSD